MEHPTDRAVYFDNAATSWPKPPAVQEAMRSFLIDVGGSPGRAGHRMSIAASRLVNDARDDLAELFGVPDPSRIAFTKNSTEALNIGIMGTLCTGAHARSQAGGQARGHAVTSSMEHNSVMRPLRWLEAQGLIDLTVVPCSPEGCLDPRDVRRALRPDTKLIVMVHASNVTGNLLPVGEVGAIARAAGVPFLVDASQTAGAHPIDIEALNIDMLAATGHKSLLGPTGTGCLYLREGMDPQPLSRGGTGSKSELEIQPDFMPDKYEAGTLNVLGIAGLGAAARFLLETGVANIAAHEKSLVQHFLDCARLLPGMRIYGPSDLAQRIGVISFTIDGFTTSKIGLLLDQEYGIMTRIGLHCAPAAHRTLGTFPDGTVRFGFSYFNTHDQIDYAIDALGQIAG